MRYLLLILLLVSPVAYALDETNSYIDPQAKVVRAIFDASCVACHGKGATGGANVVADILDVDELKAKNLVDVIDYKKSRIWTSIQRTTNWMPLGAQPLPIEQKNAIRDWMVAGAKPLIEGPPPPPPGKYQSYASMVQAIALDILKVNDNDKENTRYLTLVGTTNKGDGNLYTAVRDGANRVLNSVSFEAKLKEPVFIDATNTVYRIDLTDYGLNAAQFDDLLVVYPYAIDYFEDDEFRVFEDIIADETGSVRAYIRADWFIEQVSVPPFYYDFLGIPEKEDVLLADLGIDRAEQLEDFQAIRSGLRRSGVANFNRIIDNYEIEAYSVLGADEVYYSNSFDVVNEIALRNFFSNPFGPAAVFDLIGELVTKRIFDFDAGEVIFTLPNGMHGYAIFDAAGNRLDDVNPVIANDPNGIFDDNIIVAGASCMKCHSQGLNIYTDELRESITAGAGFNNAEVDFAKESVVTQEEVNRVLNASSNTFKASLQTVALSPNTGPGDEPVGYAFSRFLDTLDYKELAAELYLTPEDLKGRLVNAADLARDLGLQDIENGRVDRDNLEDLFNQVAVDLNLGKQIKFVQVQAPKCVIKANPNVIHKGDKSKLTLKVFGNAKRVILNGKLVSKAGGSVVVAPDFTTRFTGSVSGPGGTNTCSVEVVVKKKPQVKPTCQLAGPQWIWSGETATLRLDIKGNYSRAQIDGKVIPNKGKIAHVQSKKSRQVRGVVYGPGGSSDCYFNLNVKHRQWWRGD